jgi:tryptophan-rich sensory protein
MAVSAWLVWRRAEFEGARVALAVFAVQLALNLGWSGVFFRLKQPGWAFAEIVLLWLVIAATIVRFRRISATAASLLVPYLLWVSFATALNAAIWRLNA